MRQDALERAMERLKNGDNTAFDYIYDHTYKVVFFAAHSVLRSRQAAEDIVQDTYTTAFSRKYEYKSDNLLAWLTTIAKRLAINEYNRRKRDVFTDFAEDSNKYGVQTMPDEDSFGLIKLAEDELAPEDFQILTMCAVAGYKRREVAAIMNMPISTVSHRYAQAIKKLESKLNKGGSLK